jgi:hypothetical protein
MVLMYDRQSDMWQGELWLESIVAYTVQVEGVN